MDKSEILELNLPSRDNTTDVADINAISNNFRTIDGAFLDLVERVIPELQTKENINLNFDDDSTNEEQYPSVPAVVNFTNRKVDPLKIINSASGNTIVLKDSAKDKLNGLKLFGKTTQNGTPTPDNPIELKSVGDSGSYNVDLYGTNLCDPNIFNSMNHNGAVGNDFDSATYTLTMLDNATDSSGRYGVVPFPFEIGKEYTLSFDIRGTEGRSVRCGFDSKSITLLLTNQFKRYSVTITAYSKIQTIIMYSNSAEVGGLLASEFLQFANVQIEEGTATPYEPCNKQTFTNNDTLRGVGDIADVKDFARGAKIQRFGIVDLGTLNWIYDTDGNFFYAYFEGAKMQTPETSSAGLCEKYPLVSQLQFFETDKVICPFWSLLMYALNIRDSAYTDAITLKAALSGTMYVYELETPIETPLPETELNAYRQLYTNKPNTTIISESDMEVSYVADTKLYIDNKIAELTALTLEG